MAGSFKDDTEESVKRAREGVFCRGCYALGTACGSCSRCETDPMNPKNGGTGQTIHQKHGKEPKNKIGFEPRVLQPVAWRVKDFADGWVYFTDKAKATVEANQTGGLLEGLYAGPP